MMINECRMMKLGGANFLNHYSLFDIQYLIGASDMYLLFEVKI